MYKASKVNVNTLNYMLQLSELNEYRIQNSYFVNLRSAIIYFIESIMLNVFSNCSVEMIGCFNYEWN